MESRTFRWARALYVAAWLPYLALYTLAFTSVDQVSLLEGLAGALYYTLPPAVLGVGVIRLCFAMPWSAGRAGKLVAQHIGLALLYAASSTASTLALLKLLPLPFEEFAEGSVEPGVIVGQLFFGSLLYCIIVGFTYAALGEIRSRQQAAVAARAEALRAQAELKALRAQVNPHFLFNTLHTLLILVRRDPAAAEEALEQFGDLMRYALRVQREACDEVPLAEEWAFARDYLALEKLRFGQRLTVHADISERAREHIVPAFSLQPLLENSIAHAIAPRAAGGHVWARAHVDNGRLVLEVRDDGPGADEDAIEASDGTGLRLLRRRLAALHGESSELTTRKDEEGFSVIVDIPAKRTFEPTSERTS
jgi:signal transduction histidine kinase